MSDCIFCKIIAGEIPSEVLFEDDTAFAFREIHPVAPHHFLVVPKKHIATVNEIGDEDRDLAGHLLQVAAEVCRRLGVAESGYRIVSNVNRDAGQEVFHIHLHVIAGRKLGWPPG
jgi:histidine triad (HIT) family protein